MKAADEMEKMKNERNGLNIFTLTASQAYRKVGWESGGEGGGGKGG
jgi:hypothetical protein